MCVSEKMKDIQGIQRGACNKCECEEYRCPPQEGARLRCEYCDHTPVDHVRMITLGACKLCGDDCCEKYESETPNKYTDCQYCGCGAQHHEGAEKLIKKSGAVSDPVQAGVAVRMDPLGNPAQTSQFGLCKCPGCAFPRRVENGQVHDFCSRTCSKKYDSSWPGGSQVSPSDVPFEIVSPTTDSSGATSTVRRHMCIICTRKPANPGYDWCQRCYAMAQSQKQ